jgi:hypothetical protein
MNSPINRMPAPVTVEKAATVDGCIAKRRSKSQGAAEER